MCGVCLVLEWSGAIFHSLNKSMEIFENMSLGLMMKDEQCIF